jgi:hypothetical protein
MTGNGNAGLAREARQSLARLRASKWDRGLDLRRRLRAAAAEARAELMQYNRGSLKRAESSMEGDPKGATGREQPCTEQQQAQCTAYDPARYMSQSLASDSAVSEAAVRTTRLELQKWSALGPQKRREEEQRL